MLTDCLCLQGDADGDGVGSKPKRILYLQRRQQFVQVSVILT